MKFDAILETKSLAWLTQKYYLTERAQQLKPKVIT